LESVQTKIVEIRFRLDSKIRTCIYWFYRWCIDCYILKAVVWILGWVRWFS